MALVGTELVRVIGVINSGLAATARYVTTQAISNLRTGAPSTLTGGEVIYCYGASGAGIPSAVPFVTTADAINALGSIAPSTLTGTEIINVGPSVVGQSQAAVRLQTTTLAVANA